jgi:hypothetical protein
MAWTIALTLSCVIAPGPAQADHNFRQGSPPRGAFVPHHGPVFFNDGFHNRVFFNDRFHNRVFFHNGFHNRVFFHDPFFSTGTFSSAPSSFSIRRSSLPCL